MIGYDGIPFLGTELDINAAYGGIFPYTESAPDVAFVGPTGKTTEFHNNRRYHEFANLAAYLKVVNGFSLGGIAQYNKEQIANENWFVDQYVLDINGNPIHYPARTKPTVRHQSDHFTGGPAAKIHLGDGWKLSGGSLYGKGHEPDYFLRFSKTF